MKASELMIGDWVRRRWTCTDTGREVVKDFQVTEIRKNGETLYAFGKNGNMGRVEDLEPIPLTPEILEKNGFEKQEYTEKGFNVRPSFLWRLIIPNVGIVTISLDKNVCVIIRHDNIGSYAGAVNYVHELQHAIRLCGIKKEIVL